MNYNNIDMTEFSSNSPIHESISNEQQLEFMDAIEKIVPFMHKNTAFSTPTEEIFEVTVIDHDLEWLVAKAESFQFVPASEMQERSTEETISSLLFMDSEKEKETDATGERENDPLVPVHTSEYTMEAIVYGREGRFPTLKIKRWRVTKINEVFYPDFDVEHSLWQGEAIGWKTIRDQELKEKLRMFLEQELSFDEIDEEVRKHVESVREIEKIMHESNTVFNAARLDEAKTILEELTQRLSANS